MIPEIRYWAGCRDLWDGSVTQVRLTQGCRYVTKEDLETKSGAMEEWGLRRVLNEEASNPRK